jgi:hypothetical protein
MPFINDGALGPALPPSRGIVGFEKVTQQTTVGGFTAAGAPLVSEQPATVEQAVQQASQAVKVIPTATAPAVGNLPTTATPGAMYTFASNPGTIYVYGPDNIWRGILLVAVV